MGLHFGIDMADYLHTGELTRVANALGPVAFVGRYQPVYAMTREEVDYLHARGGRVLPIWNEDQRGTQMGGSYHDGYGAGVRAVQAWKGIGCPQGVAIYLDVEQSFWVAPGYLHGWFEACRDYAYVGGVYLNSVAGNGHNLSYTRAAAATDAPHVIFASEPQPYGWANRRVEEWSPSFPAGFGDDVTVHQYCINFGASDLDVATDRGLALMWGPEPAGPTRRILLDDAALKPTPDHTSTAVADLAAGCKVEDAPDASGASETPHWARVRVVAGTTRKGRDARGLEGWLLRADLSGY